MVFKDITPLLADHTAFAAVVDAIVAYYGRGTVDKIVGIEARGFILAAPVAYHFGAGFVPVRKDGKLPAATLAESYDLEYGSETIELHRDAFAAGDRVLHRRRRARHRGHGPRGGGARPPGRRRGGRYRGTHGTRLPPRP